ncbi:TB2/DP1, HVA22 family-domain-containing protein [Cantharellus anzutake]|uniref:TB2/DP1, HVA22 family-domain-containing protein n=1 Tax=Cantharellus anzutake TaxID=1750568 RepID=UPI001906E298|nr:TB2/DP1, HVA22 family-domain-containing protein [Cantharellus anzutake]KAF8336343.1 TB2/DP1, HVA22 family-domain-containing protein [Cantharellus anzutake]
MFYLLSRIVSLTGAFLYPAYGSYKTLAHRPALEEDLERWLMYWSVLGCIIAIEYVAEWLVRWIPFYWVIKTMFLLYLVSPQTQGATYIYKQHLEPFLSEHEQEIDTAIIKAKVKLYDFVQAKLRALWEYVSSSIINQASSSSPTPYNGAQQQQHYNSAQPPTFGDPASGPTQMAWNLWRTYGPSVIAQGSAVLAAATAAATARANTSGPGIEAPESAGSTSTNINTNDVIPLTRIRPPLSPVSPTSSAPSSSRGVTTRTTRRGVSLGHSDQGYEDARLLAERKKWSGAKLTSLPFVSGSEDDEGGGGRGRNRREPDEPSSPSTGSTPGEDTTLISHEGVGTTSVYLYSGGDDNGGKYETIDKEDVSSEEQPSASAQRSSGGGGWFGWGASSYKGYEKLKAE